MAVPKQILDAKGSWQGMSKLHLSHLPPDQRVTESASDLLIDTDDANTYATISYTWEYEGEPQVGTMLLCMDADTQEVQIGWVDSWHQSSAVMHLAGMESETGEVHTEGSFQAGDETWGWTIGFSLVGDELTVSMDVITPDGPEWAVRGSYRR